jgi:recombination protein RecR
MSKILPKSVENVMQAFEKLPGIGPKSAARMAYHFLSAPEDMSLDLAKALVKMKRSIVTCNKCFNISDTDPCVICKDNSRDRSQICVVESPLDVVAVEKAGVYEGLYHVLGGVISPADGIGPEHIRTKELKKRLQKFGGKRDGSLQRNSSAHKEDRNAVKKLDKKEEGKGNAGEEILEVIMATNPSLEGEATSAYIVDMIKKLNKSENLVKKIQVSRLAMGLPTGADLEYADRLTLKRALEGRNNL